MGCHIMSSIAKQVVFSYIIYYIMPRYTISSKMVSDSL